MAQKFGMTWWGEQWLNALSRIDYSNRLPRGAAYARKGAVLRIDVKDNLVAAKVQGSRKKPYNISITVPKFKQQEIDLLIDSVLENPTLLAQLLNRELSPQIMTIARTIGLHIFPSSWKDLGMRCSCPDWAVPCKHLAAVIYMMSRKITSPFLMRRLKTDKSIISDLPDKIEQNENVYLTENQASLYEQTLHEAMKEIEGIESTDNRSLFKRQGLVLQMILALKQICNHPALFLKNGDFVPELSGKSLLLLDLLQSIVECNQKVLIFTQFKEMGDMLVPMITKRIGERPLFLHGGCSVKERKELVERFQNNRGDCVFLLSLKAAGTGLNLTAASHVIHYDLWWNPAVEAQATDRAYRIGQHQNVLVHRFITRNTFEERIDAMIQQKKDLAELSVATGESWIGKLSNTELHEIFERRE